MANNNILTQVLVDGEWKTVVASLPLDGDIDLQSLNNVLVNVDTGSGIKRAMAVAIVGGGTEALEERITVLEDTIYEVEIFELITTGTTGTITKPTDSTIILDQYEDAGDCLIFQVDTNNKPINKVAVTSGGVGITSTFDIAGNYTLSGTPSVYPVALIYQIQIKLINLGNVPLNNIIDQSEISTAERVAFDNTESGLTSSNVQDAIDEARQYPNTYHGVVTLPSFTDNGNGSISLGAGLCIFGTVANGDGFKKRISTPTTLNISLTDNTVNYVYADYNSGTPTIQTTLSPSQFLDDARQIPLYRVIREGNELHYLDYDAYGIGLADKSFNKDIALRGFERQTGLILSTESTRISTISAGIAWFGVQNFTLSENKSGTSGELYQYYKTAGVWGESLVTQYDSTYYSDGTDRQLLGNNKYVAKYFFMGVEVDNHAYYIHGNQFNTISEALAEPLPTPPTIVTSHSIYVGKIIIQKDALNGVAYPRTFGESLLATGATSHEDLTNINQAGTGVLNGHISNVAQTIAGEKTFSDNVNVAKLNNLDFTNIKVKTEWLYGQKGVVTFDSPGNDPTGLTYDSSTGNLISCDAVSGRIYIHDGVSSTILDSFPAPNGEVFGLTYDTSTGNLISCDAYVDKIYIHDGISNTILDSFSSPSTKPTGLTYDSSTGNLISCDVNSDTIYIHDGISSTILDSFGSPGTNPYGLTYDSNYGTDKLISCEIDTDKIYIHDGVSSTILDSFSSPSSYPTGLAYESISGNLISCDTVVGKIYVHNLYKLLLI